MPDHLHFPPADRADSYVGPSSLISNRPCSPLRRIILTPHQPAVLNVLPELTHSLQNQPCWPLCLTILDPLQPAMLTGMLAPSHSLPTGRADSYIGPSSLPCNQPDDSYGEPSSLQSYRPCRQLSRPLLTHFKPAVLTVMPDHPHTPLTGRADRYVRPSSLSSNPPR